MGEKPPREVGKRVRVKVGVISQNNLYYLQNFVDYINCN